MLSFEPYLVQNARWPGAGRHILAQFDADSIVVYQAFRPMIAEEAVALQRFGPSFSLGGHPVTRRAIQLGLRGATLAELAGPAILQVQDITDVGARERAHATPPYGSLQTPSESVFRPTNAATVATLGLDPWEPAAPFAAPASSR